jgi:hypothetical protein
VTRPWLAFSGVWAKLDRAEEHAQLALNLAERYVAEAPVKLVKSLAEDRLSFAVTAYASSAPAPRLAVIVGEVVHQVRSALDHIVCELAAANGQQVLRNHQFPVARTVTSWDAMIGKGALRGLTVGDIEAIRSLQPFRNDGDPADNWLSVVSEYDNIDKHRLLLVVAAAATPSDVITLGEIIGFDFPPSRMISREGTLLAKVSFRSPVDHFNLENDVHVFAGVQRHGERFHPLEEVLELSIARGRDVAAHWSTRT